MTQALLLFLALTISRVCADPAPPVPGCTDTLSLRFYMATTVGLLESAIGEPWTLMGESNTTEPDGSMCLDFGATPYPVTGNIAYVLATSVNGALESSTEHGDNYGDGYVPQGPCP